MKNEKKVSMLWQDGIKKFTTSITIFRLKKCYTFITICKKKQILLQQKNQTKYFSVLLINKKKKKYNNIKTGINYNGKVVK
jgi:hypothetical protein